MTVCGDCANALAIELLHVSLIGNALEDSFLKAQKFSARGLGQAHHDESPIPFSPRAASATRDLYDGLQQMAGQVGEQQGIRHGLDTLHSLGHWLARQVPWIRSCSNGGEVVAYLLGLLGHASRAVDRPADLRYLGRCENVVDGAACGLELYAVDGAESLVCQCGKIWRPRDRREVLLGRVDDQLLTRTDLARALAGLGIAVTVKALDNWTTRGRLSARGTQGRPARPTYRVGDVVELIREDEERAAERQRARLTATR